MSTEPSPFADEDHFAASPVASAKLNATAQPSTSRPPATAASTSAPSQAAASFEFMEGLSSSSSPPPQGAPVSAANPATATPAASVKTATKDNKSKTTTTAPVKDNKALGTDTNGAPSPLSVWEAKRSQVLADKAAKEEAAKNENIATAKQEIAKSYATRTERVNANKTNNEVDEKTLKADMSQLMAHGTLWEKVAKLVNLQPKANEKRAQSVDRMRRLLIQMKNDSKNATPERDAAPSPAPAPGARKDGKERKGE